MTKKSDLEHDTALLFEDRTAPPGAGWGDLTRFIERAREHLPAEPDDRTRALHRASIAAALLEDRTAPSPAPTTRSWTDRTKPALARLALAVTALTGGTAGLAYAGVDLPGQAAENAFAAVGIELPNQEETAETEAETEDVTVSAHGKSVAELVRNVILNRDTFETGCEFGQAVAEAASSNNQGQGGSDQDPCSREDEGGGIEGTNQSETGAAKSAEGKAKAEQNQDGAGDQGPATTGQERSAEGKAKAEQNQDGAGQGDEASAGGRAKATERKGGPTETE